MKLFFGFFFFLGLNVLPYISGRFFQAFCKAESSPLSGGLRRVALDGIQNHHGDDSAYIQVAYVIDIIKNCKQLFPFLCCSPGFSTGTEPEALFFSRAKVTPRKRGIMLFFKTNVILNEGNTFTRRLQKNRGSTFPSSPFLFLFYSAAGQWPWASAPLPSPQSRRQCFQPP